MNKNGIERGETQFIQTELELNFNWDIKKESNKMMPDNLLPTVR